MKKTFVGFVQRTEKWDNSKEPQEHEGFPDHAAFMGSLEEKGFIAMAGLMLPSSEIIFVFLAESEDEVRATMARDPWQISGLARLVRLEETMFRIGAPKQ